MAKKQWKHGGAAGPVTPTGSERPRESGTLSASTHPADPLEPRTGTVCDQRTWCNPRGSSSGRAIGRGSGISEENVRDGRGVDS